MPPTRIVSLLPAATEMLALIGAEHLLVGRSHECDFPPSVQSLPVVTSSDTPHASAEPSSPAGGGAAVFGGGGGSLSSAATTPSSTPSVTSNAARPTSSSRSSLIDAHVRSAAASGQPLTRLNAELLADLRPDIIFTQDLCDLCAVDADSLRAVTAALRPQPTLITLTAQTVEGMLDDLITVGRAVSLEPRALAAAVALRERFFRAAEFVNPYADGPVIGFLEWTDPLFIAGHWTVQLIERAGGRHPLNPTVPLENAGAAAGPQQAEARAGPSIRIAPEIFAASRPDRLIICPCGLNLDQTRSAAHELLHHDWFRSLTRNHQIPSGGAGVPPALAQPTSPTKPSITPSLRHSVTPSLPIALIDGHQMFNRAGPRLADAFEWLVGWLHDRPELIPADFPWEPFAPQR